MSYQRSLRRIRLRNLRTLKSNRHRNLSKKRRTPMMSLKKRSKKSRQKQSLNRKKPHRLSLQNSLSLLPLKEMAPSSRKATKSQPTTLAHFSTAPSSTLPTTVASP